MAREVSSPVSAGALYSEGLVWIGHPTLGNRNIEGGDPEVLAKLIDAGWFVHDLDAPQAPTQRVYPPVETGLVWLKHPTEGNRNVEPAAVQKFIDQGYEVA